MDDATRDAYLGTLVPGADIDLRGTTIPPLVLRHLLGALKDSDSGRPTFGRARFDEASFSAPIVFDGALFTGHAFFPRARFDAVASFTNVTFMKTAAFIEARFRAALFGDSTFEDRALFTQASFSDIASYLNATFKGLAGFRGALFSAHGAAFTGTTFSDRVLFSEVHCGDRLSFDGANFTRSSLIGPLVCNGTVDLSNATFEEPLTLEAVASYVVCRRTQWRSTAALRLRYATADLTDAVLHFPVAVATHPTAFATDDGTTLAESRFAGRVDRSIQVKLISVQSADAMHLALTDIDLTDCRFSGAFHLDQIRLQGDCLFAYPPARYWRHRRLSRWTKRRALAEEHHWRSLRAGHPPLDEDEDVPPGHWRRPCDLDPDLIPEPGALAATYRHLRKAFEDGKNEPGAADFYYGECEMRRHDRFGTPPAERFLLTLYWALSGYGLRASRAFAWLLLSMGVTIVALMLWGLPHSSPRTETTGRQVEVGQELTLVTETPPPANPTGPRLTTERFESALRVAINSVVFRSSGQDLTTFGTYTEMASRIAEPALLGMAVLAIRGRVKR